MSNEWTAERIESLRDFEMCDTKGAARQIERLQTVNTALRIRLTDAEAKNAAMRAVPAEGDVVLVPRELVERLLLCTPKVAAHDLQICLDAPQPRVVQAGDVVIPAGVIESAINGLRDGFPVESFQEIWGAEARCLDSDAAIARNALAMAIGETKCK